MRGYSFCLMTITLVLLQGGVAPAGSAIALRAVVHNCQDQTVDADARIAACSQMIPSGLASSGVLCAFYFFRSLAYEAKGDLANAIRDNDKALELQPDYADALANRTSLQSKVPHE